MRWGIPTILLLLFAGVGIVVTPKAQAQKGTEAFHRFHIDDQSLACTDCHSTPKEPAPGQEISFSERPYHPACTDCHNDDFTSDVAAGPICLTCHTGKDQDLALFPTGKYTLAHFSHAVHVDPRGRVNKITGVRQDCIACHRGQQETEARAEIGSHPECAPCHAGEKLAKPELSKAGESCLGCHSIEKIDRNLAERRRGEGRPVAAATTGVRSGIQPVAAHNLQRFGSPWDSFDSVTRMRARSGLQMVAAGDAQSSGFSSGGSSYAPVSMRGRPAVQFATAKNPTQGQPSSLRKLSYRDILPVNHGRHLRNRDGSAIDCVTCHTSTLESKEVGGPLSLPTMQECASCHENATLVRQPYLTQNCEVCHKAIRADMRPMTREGFSPTIAHTEFFRRHHEEAAQAKDNQCHFCHVETANAQQDNCSGCHSAMRPRDHMAVRYAETTHGRLAAMDRKACAVCHTSDSCNLCHNIPPRSHFPLAFFRQGSHRTLAMLNLRSCFACHTFENTCMECHARQPGTSTAPRAPLLDTAQKVRDLTQRPGME